MEVDGGACHPCPCSAGGVDCCQCVLNKKILPAPLQVTHLLTMEKKIRQREREDKRQQDGGKVLDKCVSVRAC